MKKEIKNYSLEFVQIIFGSLIMSFGIAQFLVPNQLSSGGFSGIAIIIYYLFHFPIGTAIFILNIPLFILAYFKLGKQFFIKAIVGTASLTIFLDILENFNPLTEDRFLACIYGGVIIGIGNALVLKAKGSTGGTELLTNVIKAYKPQTKLSSLLVVLDTIIITINVIFFKHIEIGLYSAITIYITGKMLDIFFEGIHFTKVLLIVSSKYEDISKRIEKDIERGVTGLYGKGMYTGSDKTILLCVTSRREVTKIREIIKTVDPNAFMVITNAREAFGKGFKSG